MSSGNRAPGSGGGRVELVQGTNDFDGLPVEFVCVVSERDVAIVRYMLASLAISTRHLAHPPRVHAFVDHSCIPAFSRIIEVPVIRHWLDVRFIDKGDYAETLTGDGFRDQMLLKFLASAVVATPYYWVIDCDYFFLAPLRIRSFMREGRPTYVVEPWFEGADDTRRWRCATEEVMGESVPLNGLIEPPYMLSVAVVRALLGDHDLFKRFRDADPPAAEFHVYSAFALSLQPEAHHWLTDGGTGAIRVVNQDRIDGFPRLDAEIALSAFEDCQAVVFWSHWDACEVVMRRCLRELLAREQISEVGNESLLVPYHHPTSAIELTGCGLRAVHGVYSDGWVHPEIHMEMECDADQFVLQLEADWDVTVAVAFAGSPTVASYRIGPEATSGEVVIAVPGGTRGPRAVSLTFSNHQLEVPTGRRLVAREASWSLHDATEMAGQVQGGNG